MSSCEDDLESALKMANAAIGRLFNICPTDELLRLVIEPLKDKQVWTEFQERFGDKSGLWKDHPACANAVFWQNYAKAMDDRAGELTEAATQSAAPGQLTLFD